MAIFLVQHIWKVFPTWLSEALPPFPIRRESLDGIVLKGEGAWTQLAIISKDEVKFPASGEIAGIGTPSVQETGLCLGKTPLGAWCLTCQVISCLWCVPWLGREHGFLVIRQTQVPFSAQGLEAACVPHPCFHKRLRRGFLTVYHRARTTQQSQSE